ncbi:MAG TPA: hypothetical protein DHW64_02535 [Chitinophagaceae bacterium]|nr:hypothetical protein [Chitinophagaceae bacterium]
MNFYRYYSHFFVVYNCQTVCKVNTPDKKQKPADDFLSLLPSPARRALLFHGIDTVEKLASYTEKEILSFHGIGPASMPILRQALNKEELKFKEQ